LQANFRLRKENFIESRYVKIGFSWKRNVRRARIKTARQPLCNQMSGVWFVSIEAFDVAASKAFYLSKLLLNETESRFQ
jgi:hypothetical protein